MSVTLSPPSQLGFPRPLTTIVKRSLLIHNPHSSPVAFKVKTTAPKQYCVRPNQGRVEPAETIEVQIVLQPLPSDPPPHAKCKDKFLVQSAFIPPDEEIRNLPEMWAQVEKTNKAAIQEQKIRCAYLAAEDGSGDPNGIPEENEDSPIDHSRLQDSTFDSPSQPSRNEEWIAAQSSPIPSRTVNGDSKDLPATPSRSGLGAAAAGAAAGAGALGAIAAGNASGQPSGTREIPSLSAGDVQRMGAPTNVALEQSLSATATDSEKLAVANQEIERLRAQLAEAQGPNVTGLRKRGGAPTDAAPGGAIATKTAQAPAQGIPLEVCAGLVFAVFVLTYLFF